MNHPTDAMVAPARTRHLTLVAATTLALCLAAGAALALAWITRQPMINAWDELGHINHSLADRLILLQQGIGALRDHLFIGERWLPPGVRFIGLPIALAAGDAAMPVLRITAIACHVATVLLLVGTARMLVPMGPALMAGVFFAATPIALLLAQDFMTECALHPLLALALLLMAREIAAPRARWPSLLLLGAVLGAGALAKLTFLPAAGVAFLVMLVLAHRRTPPAVAWRMTERRVLLPLIPAALVGWPHYVLNGGRYLEYARATAAGFAFATWPETGLAFVARALLHVTDRAVGPGLMLAMVLVLGLALASVRARHEPPERRDDAAALLLLGLAAGGPSILAFFLSSNQTTRYLGTGLLGIALAVAALLTLTAPRLRALGIWSIAGLAVAQVLVAGAVAATGPQGGRLAGFSALAWRNNTACTHDALAELARARGLATPRIAIVGLSSGVNRVVVRHAFLRAGSLARVWELIEATPPPIDWDALMGMAAASDIVLVLDEATPAATATYPVANGARETFVARLEVQGGFQRAGVLPADAPAACRVRVFLRTASIAPQP